jgi:hypothetical protein
MRVVVETYTKTVYEVQAEAIRDHFIQVGGGAAGSSSNATTAQRVA